MQNRDTTHRLGRGLGSSFSLRLSIYILLVTSTIFVVTLVVTYRTARQQVESEVISRSQTALDNTILRISSILGEVEATVESYATTIELASSDSDELYAITDEIVGLGSNIIGSAIALLPCEGRYCAPYSYRHNDTIAHRQLGTRDYGYDDKEWFITPLSSGRPHWSEPYYDAGGAESNIATYSYPLRDNKGDIYAILTADISIEQFAEQVRAIKPYPDAYNFMISRSGAFLAHSRHEALHKESIFENAKRFGEPELRLLANKMVAMESGITLHRRGGIDYYVIYAPVENTGWSIAVASPYTNIFSSVYDLRRAIIAIFSIGIVLIVVLSYVTIRRMTRPLKQLTLSATEIASGNFALPTPKVDSGDEMQQLRDSFEDMRTSLIAYIEELRTTTAQRERMASELRVARDIQLGMLPKDEDLAQYGTSLSIASRLIAAKEVGGDLYNFFVEGGRLHFIVGDVSGKGVPAALVMAVICRMFRTVANVTTSPAEILSILGRVLAERNDSNMFCTAFVGILDLESGELSYANAGHNPPIIFGGCKEPEYLAMETNIPLGIVDDYVYVGGRCSIAQGEHILVYTDGVTEATDAQGGLYGESRLAETLSHCRAQQPYEVLDRVFEELSRFSQGCEQSDDIAMLDIRVTER